MHCLIGENIRRKKKGGEKRGGLERFLSFGMQQKHERIKKILVVGPTKFFLHPFRKETEMRAWELGGRGRWNGLVELGLKLFFII